MAQLFKLASEITEKTAHHHDPGVRRYNGPKLQGAVERRPGKRYGLFSCDAGLIKALFYFRFLTAAANAQCGGDYTQNSVILSHECDSSG